MTQRSHDILRLDPAQTVFAVVIHRIAALALPRFASAEHHQCLVRCQQRFRERIAPVDAQSWTRDLHPAVDVGHERQLPREDLGQQQIHHLDAGGTQAFFDERHGVRVALSAQRAEDEPPSTCFACACESIGAIRQECGVVVGLVGEATRIRIVSVGGDGRVVDHGALEVKATVAEVQDEIDGLFLGEVRRGTAEDFAFAERRDLWDEDVVSRRAKLWCDAVQRGIKLNGPDHGDGAARLEVAIDARQEVFDVNGDIDKDVQRGDLGDVDRDETAVCVVDQHVAAERSCGVVVDAAGAVRHVSHDQRVGSGAELCDDVADGGGEEEQSLGHLQRDLLRSGISNSMDRLVQFKVVVLRQQSDGLVDGLVVQDVVWDVVQGTRWPSRRRHYMRKSAQSL